MIEVMRIAVVKRKVTVVRLRHNSEWVPCPPRERSLAEESLSEGWSGVKGMIEKQAAPTAEQKQMVAQDRFIREEILIPAAKHEDLVAASFRKMMKKKMVFQFTRWGACSATPCTKV